MMNVVKESEVNHLPDRQLSEERVRQPSSVECTWTPTADGSRELLYGRGVLRHLAGPRFRR